MAEIYVKLKRLVEQESVVKVVIEDGAEVSLEEIIELIEDDSDTITELHELADEAQNWQVSSVINDVHEDIEINSIEENMAKIMKEEDVRTIPPNVAVISVKTRDAQGDHEILFNLAK
ncbi:MAG: hypothetical protein WBB28_01685 [Crinalium sp.]